MQFDSIAAAVEPAPRETVIAFARSLLAARKLRNELLFEVDFDDIEWFVLIDLFIAAAPQERPC